MSDIRIIHGDCMEAMKEMPDKAFFMAILHRKGLSISGPRKK